MKKIILNKVYKKSPNYKKYYTVIDDEDFERVNKYNWNIMKQPNTIYAQSYIDGKFIYLHIFIMGFKGIDHIDGNGLNCQKSNMRKATSQQNNMNSSSRKNSSSKFKGVCWDKARNKWKALIKHNYKTINLGRFISETEAAIAYNEKAVELFGEFAKLNIV